MLKKLLLLLLLPTISYSQSLTVSVDNRTSGNRYTTFGLHQHNVTFANNGIQFPGSGRQFGDYLSFATPAGYGHIGVIQNTARGAQTYLLSTLGDTLSSFETISVSYDDPSLALFPMRSGEVLLRNNIANFTLYEPLGTIKTSASSGSQSRGGESISEVAVDPRGITVVLYTPKIKRDGQVGSQAQLLDDNNATNSIFYSNNRYLKYAGVSDDGQFILLITAREGRDDHVMVMDRFGNELTSISTDEDLVAGYFTESSSELVIHSNRRAIVYKTLNGERVGSTSFRAPLLLARYFSADNTIVGLTASKVENTEIYRDLQFHAINLQQREIARRELGGAIGTSPNIPMKFVRVGTGRYRFLGANKIINLRATF
ncbi:MAG: hypothetical protein R3281_14230 [Balneolaceae bacterium]|nr:hypothetical protein [Balneolaceae bacterium]